MGTFAPYAIAMIVCAVIAFVFLRVWDSIRKELISEGKTQAQKENAESVVIIQKRQADIVSKRVDAGETETKLDKGEF